MRQIKAVNTKDTEAEMTRKQRIAEDREIRLDKAYMMLRGIMWGSLAALVVVTTMICW